jgi:trehalose 6-phosphate phosphatase
MDPALAGPLALALQALGARPGGVATDLDGTLSPIVTHAREARLADGAAEALAGVAARLEVVAIVTGRTPADARGMLGTDAMLVVANHGAEWLEPGQAPDPAARATSEAVDAAVSRLPAEEGMTLERKGASVTVHFRNVRDPEATRRRITDLLAGTGLPGVTLHRGRMSVELRPSGSPTKGDALRHLVARFGLRGLLVLGDDVTDLDMFKAAAELRAAGKLSAAILAVAGGDEVPSQVGEAADAVLASPLEVVSLLRELARVL